jgi:hypothetical protein
MKALAAIPPAAIAVVLSVWAAAPPAGAVPPEKAEANSSPVEAAPATAAKPPASLDEARARARLLHEAIHGALQVMHRDFYREGEKLPLPSRSLDDVFAEMARTHGVQIRWMAVNAQAMNVDHEAQDEFEKHAVEVLAAGQEEYGAVESGRYRHAGRVKLASDCLGCHLPSRNSTRDRVAGLVISMPVGK